MPADSYRIIRTLLASHQPGDDKEASDIKQIQRLMQTQPDLLSPACQTGHVTASALIVDPASRRLLLHYHKRLRRWLQVGGHLEDETDPAVAALREAREETGLPDLVFYPANSPPAPVDIDIHRIPATASMPQHLHLDFRYLLLTRQPSWLRPAAGESTFFRWLSFAEAARLDDAIDPGLKRLMRKAERQIPGFA